MDPTDIKAYARYGPEHCDAPEKGNCKKKHRFHWLGISLTTSNLADLRKLTYNHRRRSYDCTEIGYAMTPEQKARVVCE